MNRLVTSLLREVPWERVFERLGNMADSAAYRSQAVSSQSTRLVARHPNRAMAWAVAAGFAAGVVLGAALAAKR